MVSNPHTRGLSCSPVLACLKKILSSGEQASHSGGGRPGLGGLRTAGLSPLAGLLDYEDTRLKYFVLCPDETLLGVEGKLGNTYMDISSFVTDLV